MQRREFCAALAGAGAWAAGTSARAQGNWVAGQHYLLVDPPVPVSVPAGRIEVIEFFWYGCPHCNHFEPLLEAWARKLPADVVLRRVPVVFREQPYGVHQRIFYALEAMGQLEAMHAKVFAAIHRNRQRLDDPADIAAFMSQNGLDGARFTEVFNSFSVASKCRQGRQLADAYKVQGVPSIGVQGRYYTLGEMAGSPEGMLAVTDFLVSRLRRS